MYVTHEIKSDKAFYYDKIWKKEEGSVVVEKSAHVKKVTSDAFLFM